MAGAVRHSKEPVSFKCSCWKCIDDSCGECYGGERTETCATSLVVAPLWAVFIAYRAFVEHGVLPWSGGLFEQSAAFVSVVRLMDRVIADARTEGP